jgi:hypothetical protein
MSAEGQLLCKSCDSRNRRAFIAEIAIHIPGSAGLTRTVVWALPKLFMCLDCGLTQFTTDEKELQVLRDGSAR